MDIPKISPQDAAAIALDLDPPGPCVELRPVRLPVFDERRPADMAPVCYSASGTAHMLRGIVNRGGLIDGDTHALNAALAIIEDGIRRRVL